jgi:GT2 family glycosyltransferase
MSAARINAVILNYNSHAATLDGVRELAASQGVQMNVLVVDNASAANDRAALQTALQPDQLLMLPQNLGYAGGMNAGINYWLARAPDTPVLLVTPDARVGADVAHALLQTLQADAKVGAVGPVILYREEPRRIGAGGAVDDRGRISLLPDITSATPYDVAWIEGCCMLLKPDAFRSVQGFDEQYFLYYEEIDLCERLRKAGWHVRLEPAVTVHHPKPNVSAPPHVAYYMTRNGYRFRSRHFNVPTIVTAWELAQSGIRSTAIALACTLLPQRWREMRGRWRDSSMLWRGVWTGTRDHLRGRYGPGQVSMRPPT